MDIQYVTRYLDDYIKMSSPQFAVMLKGKWGCGKTYYIRSLIDKWNSEINEPAEDGDDQINLRPIYITLNGLSNISQVSFLIRRELRPLLYSKGVKVAKKVLCGIIKTVTKSSFDLDGDGEKDDLSEIFDAESIIEILSKSNDSIKGDKILIFDDLERCKIPVDEIFGYINHLVEHSSCKVIIICEEDKIKERYDNCELKVSYKDFKEKLIGMTFSVQPNFVDVIHKFICDNSNKYLVDNENLVLELFIASNIENLRVIRQSFSDIDRLIKDIEPQKYKDILFNEFIKNVIAYFIIVYCEYRSGNMDICHFQDIQYYINEDERLKVSTIENKYKSILEKYEIKHSAYSLKIRAIIDFIDNGYIADLQNILEKNEILNKRQIADWEHLWSYWELDNDQFINKLKLVKNIFYRGDIEYVTIVIHIAGILLKFNRINLSHCNEEYVIKKAKKHIDRIFHAAADKDPFMSFGKQYLEHNSDEIKSLIKYATDKMSDFYETKRISYCKRFWENIRDEESDNIYNVFSELIPSGDSTYNHTTVLYGVDSKKVSQRFMNLSNESKYNLMIYLIHRYSLPGCRIEEPICDYHRKDLQSLEAIRDILSVKKSRLKLIDKIATDELVNTLNKCIDQLT